MEDKTTDQYITETANYIRKYIPINSDAIELITLEIDITMKTLNTILIEAMAGQEDMQRANYCGWLAGQLCSKLELVQRDIKRLVREVLE